MKNIPALITLCVLVLSIPAYSNPSGNSFGGNCAACHSQVTALGISGNDTTLKVNPRLDAPVGNNTSFLPSFTVDVGTGLDTVIHITLTLPSSGGPGSGDNYAFSIGGTMKVAATGTQSTDKSAQESLVSASTVLGIKNSIGDTVSFTLGTNTGWSTRTVGTKTYFSTSITAWPGSTTSSTFDMTIKANTPLDVYTMTARAGWTGPVGSSQEFLINVIPEPGVFALLGLGTIGLVAWNRKRRKT